MDKNVRLQLAWKLMIEKRHGEAEEFLKPLVASAFDDPDNPFSLEVLFIHTYYLMRQNQWQSVELLSRDLLQMTALKSMNSEFQFQLKTNLIMALVELEKREEASKHIEQILSDTDASPEMLFRKGNLLGTIKRFEESVDYYKKCLILDRYNVPAFLGLRRSFQVIGTSTFSFLCLHCEHTAEPLVYYDEKRDAETLHNLGVVYTTQFGLVPDSLRYISCENCGKHTMYFLHICRECYSGHTGQMSINHEPENRKDFYQMKIHCNVCYKRLKIDTDDPAEVEFMSKLVSVTPGYSGGVQYVKQIEEEVQKIDPKALKELWYDFDEWTNKLTQLQLMKQVDAYRGEARYLTGEGLNHLRSGRLEEAEKVLEKAIDEKSDYAAAWYYLGEIYDKRGKLDEAEKAFRKSIECDPVDTRAMVDLFTILLEQKRGLEALQMGLQIVNVEPRAVIIWESLAKVYLAFGDNEKSKECEERAGLLMRKKY